MADTPKPSERQARTPLPRKDGEGKGPGFRTPRMRILLIIVALLAANYLFVALFAPGEVKSVRVPYSPTFLEQIRAGNVDRVSTTGATVEGRFNNDFKYQDNDPTKAFETEIPVFANDDELSKLLEDEKVTIEAEPVNQSRGFLASLILGFGPVILIIALFVYFARRAGGGGMSAIGNFGRSRARRVEGGQQKITFADVAGIDEAKAELSEIVDFLKSPERYQKLGGRIPKGVLLSGRPGTGKTLLARAVAGEADAPFFSISASEFIEAIVGIGASRVRDLFKQAKEAAPAIIFIDELDAIGRSRSAGTGFGGGNDEREQTLNQILTEMDGFEANVAVIVLGATNRPEILDAALLRPGRFDRRVAVPAPTARAGRRSSPSTPARSRSATTSTSTGSPRPRPGWSAPTSRTSRTRRHWGPRAGATTRSRWRISPTRWRRSCSAPRAGRSSPTRTAAASPITRPATRSSGCSRPARTRSARSRSSPAARRSASPSPRPTTTAPTTRSPG